MSQSSYALLTEQDHDTATMKALMFHGPGQITVENVPIPKPGRVMWLSGLPYDHLRYRPPHPERRIPGKAGADHRPRTGGSHSRDRRRRHRISSG